MSRTMLSLVLALLVVAAACGSDADGEAATTTTQSVTTEPVSTTSVTEPTVTDAAAADTDQLSTPVGEQLQWFVDLLNADTDPTVAELEAHFAPEFLAQVPAEEMLGTTGEIFAGAEAPFTLVEIDQDDTGLQAQALVESVNGVGFNLSMAVQPDDPHLIQGFFIAPATAELATDVTIEGLQADLEALAAESALGVYDVTDGACTVVHEARGEQPIPLGSAFKLWILAELAHQVSSGEAAWDEPLPVVDEHRSSPDGQVFPLPTGTELTLQEHAELMISISDNTATDHLLARLGRGNVEAAMVRIGITDPEANVPLLSTGALFQLKFIPTAPNAADYRALDAAGRAGLLDDIDAATLPWIDGVESVELQNAEGVPIDQPRDLDIEWFASPFDLCQTHVHLAELAATPGLEPVADILEMNPGQGLGFDRDRWPTIRFKGGSEPGVLAAAWWFEGEDGDRYVVAGGASDPDIAFDDVAAVSALASAINLVAGR